MTKRLRIALSCALVGVGCVSIGLTASGMFFVGATALSTVARPEVYSAIESTVLTDSEAGYDQAAFDACVDSSDEVTCE